MKIDRGNYEEFFLDYLEGVLSKEDRITMELFLAENPDLAVELDEDLPTLQSIENLSVSMKDSLSKRLIWDEKEVEILLLNQLEGNVEEFDNERLSQFQNEFPDQTNRLRKLILNTVLPSGDVALEEGFKFEYLNSNSVEDVGIISQLEKAIDEQCLEELKHQSHGENMKLLMATVLDPGVSELSSDFKKGLKRREAVVIPLWVRGAVGTAAVLMLAFLLPWNHSTDSVSNYSPRETLENLGTHNTKSIADVDDLFTFTVNSQEASEAKYSERDNVKTNSPVSVAETFPNKETISRMTIERDDFISSDLFVAVRGERLALQKVEVFENSLADNDGADITIDSPLEFAENQIKKAFLKNDKNKTAPLAFLNKSLKKITKETEDVLVFEDNREEDRGFKFKLGKLCVESTR